jgi:hypothetical protein
VEGAYEHGNEPSGSIKRWEVLEWLHNWQLLKKGSAPSVIIHSFEARKSELMTVSLNKLHINKYCTGYPGAGIAQSVYRLATGWTAEGSEFESRWGQKFSILHVVPTGSRVHPTAYPMITGGKAAGA